MSSAATATLTWIDNSQNEDGFKIERNLNGGTFAPQGAVGPNITTFIDNSLVQAGIDNNYCYQVIAFNKAGDAAPSNQFCALIAKPPMPSGSTGLAIVLSDIPLPPITINWSVPPGVKPSAKDWVALYRVTDPDRTHLSGKMRCGGKQCWIYTNGAPSGTWVVTPPGPGTYDARYMLNDGFTSALKSRGAYTAK